jgi:MFS family permease
VAVLFFAQLGPLLLLSPVGGVLADVFDRRRLLLACQVPQLVFSLVLALLATSSHPDEVLLALCVLVIGVANALGAPALSSILPTLVPKPDLPGAVSLQSVQMNLSRVIGPAIGAAIYAGTGAPLVFVINAGTYLFAIVALMMIRYPAPVAVDGAPGLLSRLGDGFRVARDDPLVRRVLITLVTLSFFSLAFVGMMPVIAADNLGLAPRSVEYGLFSAVFGLGAALGAISVGTLFAHSPRARLVRPALLAFAVLLVALALVRSPALAMVVAPVLGYAYFVVITSLSTVLQEHVDDAVRGRVLALWIMGFGGTVPLGVLVAGPLAQATSITLVLLIGAAFAVGLAFYADLRAAGAPD